VRVLGEVFEIKVTSVSVRWSSCHDGFFHCRNYKLEDMAYNWSRQHNR